MFGPAGMDVKLDKNRFNRYNRVHLPDVLKGPNQFLTGASTVARPPTAGTGWNSAVAGSKRQGAAALTDRPLCATDRIDGLITDSTNSPFTTLILPYQYVETPDAKVQFAPRGERDVLQGAV